MLMTLRFTLTHFRFLGKVLKSILENFMIIQMHSLVILFLPLTFHGVSQVIPSIVHL